MFAKFFGVYNDKLKIKDQNENIDQVNLQNDFLQNFVDPSIREVFCDLLVELLKQNIMKYVKSSQKQNYIEIQQNIQQQIKSKLVDILNQGAEQQQQKKNDIDHQSDFASINSILILISIQQICQVICESIKLNRVKSVLQNIGLKQINIFNLPQINDQYYFAQINIIFSIFDKISVQSELDASFIFLNYQINSNLVSQSQKINLKNKGIIEPSIGVMKFIELVMKNLQIIQKDKKQTNNIYTVIDKIILQNYSESLEQICQQQSDQKYSTVFQLENLYWLQSSLQQFISSNLKNLSFSQYLELKTSQLTAKYVEELYYYQFEDKIFKEYFRNQNIIKYKKKLQNDDYDHKSNQQIELNEICTTILGINMHDVKNQTEKYIKIYLKNFSISNQNYKNELQKNFEKILKRINKHLCNESLQSQLFMLCLNGLKVKIQEDLRLLKIIIQHLRTVQKENELKNGQYKVNNKEEDIEDESEYLFNDQIMQIWIKKYASQKL